MCCVPTHRDQVGLYAAQLSCEAAACATAATLPFILMLTLIALALEGGVYARRESHPVAHSVSGFH